MLLKVRRSFREIAAANIINLRTVANIRFAVGTRCSDNFFLSAGRRYDHRSVQYF